MEPVRHTIAEKITYEWKEALLHRMAYTSENERYKERAHKTLSEPPYYMRRKGFVKNGKVDLTHPMIRAVLLELKESGKIPPDFVKESPEDKK